MESTLNFEKDPKQKGLSKEEVEEVRKRGGKIVYRMVDSSDGTMSKDLRGNIYKNEGGVLTKIHFSKPLSKKARKKLEKRNKGR